MPNSAKRGLDYAMGRVLAPMLGEEFVCNGIRFWALAPEPLQVVKGFPRGTSVGAEHDLEFQCAASAITGEVPRKGNTITRDGIKYIIVDVQKPPGSHLITFLVNEPQPV